MLAQKKAGGFPPAGLPRLVSVAARPYRVLFAALPKLAII